jgi:hypothetical protein
MNCPRCGEPLGQEGPNPHWLRFFECDQCWLAFEAVVEGHFEHRGHGKGRTFFRHTITLQPGRTPLPAGWMRN